LVKNRKKEIETTIGFLGEGVEAEEEAGVLA
jgi:hypothetical protein